MGDKETSFDDMLGLPQLGSPRPDDEISFDDMLGARKEGLLPEPFEPGITGVPGHPPGVRAVPEVEEPEPGRARVRTTWTSTGIPVRLPVAKDEWGTRIIKPSDDFKSTMEVVSETNKSEPRQTFMRANESGYKGSLMQRALSGLSDIFGIDYDPNAISETAKAQAWVQSMANVKGVPLHEYRQSPELIEQAAAGFVNTFTFGMAPAIREAVTGEVDYPATNVEGHIGGALGSLAGLIQGPFRLARYGVQLTGKGVTRIAKKYGFERILARLPQATQESSLIGRTLMASLHDALVLGAGMGTAATGEALGQTTFTEFSKVIGKSTLSGAVTGTLFGLARGMFPGDANTQRATRIITGLMLLNVQRVAETGGNPFTDRPVGEVVFDIALDTYFLWKGLPARRFEELAKAVESGDYETARKAMVEATDEAMARVDVEATNRDIERIKKTAGKAEIEAAEFEVRPEEYAALEKRFGENWEDQPNERIARFLTKHRVAGKKVEPKEEPRLAEEEVARDIEAELDKYDKDIITEKATRSTEVEGLSDIEAATGKSLDRLEPKDVEKFLNDKEVDDFLNGIDLDTGVPRPARMEGDASPFRVIDRDIAKSQAEAYGRNPLVAENMDALIDQTPDVPKDPLITSYKLVNDMNRWLNGEGVDPGMARDFLSRLAGNAEDFRWGFVDEAGNMDAKAFNEWRSYTQDAAEWARTTERASESATTDLMGNLNLFVDPSRAPAVIRELYESFRRDFAGRRDPNRAEAKEIYERTGFFFNPYDRRWRFEIDDSKLKLRQNFEQMKSAKFLDPGTRYKLDDFIDYPDLFAAYPEIANVRVRKARATEISGSAELDPTANEVILAPDNTNIRRSLVHELQHWIQERSGFAEGGSVDTAIDQAKGAQLRSLVSKAEESLKGGIATQTRLREEDLNNIRNIEELAGNRTFMDLLRRFIRLEDEFYLGLEAEPAEFPKSERGRVLVKGIDNLVGNMATATGKSTDLIRYLAKTMAVDNNVAATLTRLRQMADDRLDKIESYTERVVRINGAKNDRQLKWAIKDSATASYEAYAALAGEIEARDVAARAKMSERERRETIPLSSEEYRKEDVIVRFGDARRSESRRRPEETITRLREMRNVVFRTGRPTITGKPMHGTDFDALPGILEKGLRGGSAIDIKGDWIGEYPVAVSVPGAKLGEYVRHNEYYKSKGSADATTVYVDLSQYQPVYVNKYRNMVHDLAKKYPDVNFRILNDPGKYTAKYTVEDLIRLTEEATELYKRGPDPRIAELEKQKDELRAPYRTGEGYYKNIPRQVHDTVVEIDKEIAGLRRAGNREISEAEAKIRDAERDVDIVEGTDFSGETLYSGIPLDAIGRQVSAYWKASKEATRIKAKEAKAILRESLTKHWLNQAGNIRRDMERIGQGAYDLIIAQTLAKGGHPRATNMRKQATHEYRRGFSRAEKEITDKLIMAKRVLAIDETPSGERVSYPEAFSVENSRAIVGNIGSKKINGVADLTPKKVAKIERAAEAYFDWMRIAVDDAHKAGLIGREERDALIANDYFRFQNVKRPTIAGAFDRSRQTIIGGRKRSVYDSGIKTLAKGQVTDIFETNSELMMLETFTRLYNRAHNNLAMQELMKYSRDNSPNSFVRMKEPKVVGRDTQPTSRSGLIQSIHIKKDMAKMSDYEYKARMRTLFKRSKTKYLTNEQLAEFDRFLGPRSYEYMKQAPEDRIPRGWRRHYGYENGARKSVWLSPEFSKEWLSMSAEVTGGFAKFLRIVSGAPIVRLFATGINPIFAITNLPRDVMHAWFAARVMEDGKWKSLYSANAPVAMAQMGADFRDVFYDVIHRTGRHTGYINEGGGMDFLVQQGMITNKGRGYRLETGFDKVENVLSYLNLTSELMTRLAIRERAIKRKAKQLGISVEEARKDPRITREATFAAVDQMNFGEGGGFSKAIDNFMPYLNARIVGTRTLFRTFKLGSTGQPENWLKLATFAGVVVALYSLNYRDNPETMKDLQDDPRSRNSLIIPLGDKFGYTDERGNKRYPFFRIPIDQSQVFFKTLFEALTDKYHGREANWEGVVAALKDASPADLSTLPPTLSAAIGYFFNLDTWRGEKVWKRTDEPLRYRFPYGADTDQPKPLVDLRPEGSAGEFVPGVTPEFYVDVGRATGLSPERLRFATEELLTHDNVYAQFGLKAYEEIFGSLPESQREELLADAISKVPGVRRFYGVTNPEAGDLEDLEAIADERRDINWQVHREFDSIVNGYLHEGTKTYEDVMNYIGKWKDPSIIESLTDEYIFQQTIKDLPHRRWWTYLRGRIDVQGRAEAYVKRMRNATVDEAVQLNDEIPIVDAAGGVLTEEFWQRVEFLWHAD